MADKSEEPTPRRLRKAREQGDSPVSAALLQGAAFCAALALAPAALAVLAARSAALLRSSIGGGGAALPPLAVATEVLLASAPLLGVAALAAAALGVVRFGREFATEMRQTVAALSGTPRDRGTAPPSEDGEDVGSPPP